MKKLLLLLAGCCTLSPAQDTGVETSVLSYRRSYRVPTIEGTPRMTMSLAFTPPAGFVVREQASLKGSIKGTDATGKSIACKTSAVSICPKAPGCAQTELELSSHPKGDWLRLQGNVKLTLAADVTLQPRHKLSLTEPSEFTLGGVTYKATPAVGNKAKSNLERGQLQTAELTLTYPDTVHVLHICRIWEDADIADSPAHRQELTTSTEKGKDGTTRLHVTLWDAKPQETIEIVTCEQLRTVETPIDLHMNLGGQIPASELPATTTKP